MNTGDLTNEGILGLILFIIGVVWLCWQFPAFAFISAGYIFLTLGHKD